MEKIPIKIFPDDNNDLSAEIAKIIAAKIKEKDSLGQKTVLGLATGHTPLDVYRELIRLHQQENLSFRNVITFNLDEYLSLPKDEHRSYHRFMMENLFNSLDIEKGNIHIPDGALAENEIAKYCGRYEEEIKKAGGIDIQILGIGRDGHIGFNEPGSSMDSITRLITLDDITRKDALGDFGEMKYVPKKAITMGISTIMNSKQVILIARGSHKAKVIKETIEGEVTANVAASHLQEHKNVIIFADEAASCELTRIKTPWELEKVDWSDKNMRQKALLHLVKTLKKPLSEITAQDLQKSQMQEMLNNFNLKDLTSDFAKLAKSKIKNAEELPRGKKILIFSPHPDDDVISLGGVLQKLVENQNTLVSVYMTPGYNAVFDHAVESFLLQMEKVHLAFEFEDKFKDIKETVETFLAQKKSLAFGALDIPEVLKIKTVIRMVEAISACKYLGIKKYEFLKMPFYRAEGAKKMPIGQRDIKEVSDVLNKYNPDIIFLADDLNDPNGTHRLCQAAIRKALREFGPTPEIWLYRGAWQEYSPLEANVFAPLNEDEIKTKKESIFRHESQKDTPPLPGASDLEFWQRAQARNKATAELINLLTGENYLAIEAFQVVSSEQ